MDGNIPDYIKVAQEFLKAVYKGHRFFLYHINDMPIGLKSTLRHFADDTISYMTVSNTPDAETLQADLDKLATWEQKWKMVFHQEKCNVVSIGNVNQ